jgi:hypothetical protein
MCRLECEKKEKKHNLEMQVKKQERIAKKMKMELINDENMDGREGWKRRRYGRAVCIMKMRKPGSRKVRKNNNDVNASQVQNMDPSKFKLGLYKFNVELPNVSCMNLTWNIPECDQPEPLEIHLPAGEETEVAIENDTMDVEDSPNDSIPSDHEMKIVDTQEANDIKVDSNAPNSPSLDPPLTLESSLKNLVDGDSAENTMFSFFGQPDEPSPEPASPVISAADEVGCIGRFI